MRLGRQVLVQVMQPVDGVTESQRLVRTDKQLTLVLIKREQLAVIRVPRLVLGQILLDVFIYGQSAGFNELVKT